jgi:Fanconi anemia group M protein
MKIIADIREKNSLVISELKSLGVEVELKYLKLADYLISSEIAVERKTINDFVSSMINRRLPEQLRDMKANFKIPLLIIEKEDHQNLYKPSLHSQIHENAIRGMLLSIATEFQIPYILTEGYEDTAKYLMLLAKRQEKNKSPISLVAKRKAFSPKEQQRIIVESFPGIGPSLAKEIIKKFKTIKNFANSSIEEIESIPKLGKKKALIIKRIFEASYG